MIRRPPRSTLFPYTNALPISFAALLVNVTARIFQGKTLRSRTRWATRRVITRVLPEPARSEEHTSELQSQSNLVCRLLLEKKKKKTKTSADLICTAYARLRM